MNQTTLPNARLGPIMLAPGVRRSHVLAYLWASFVSIGIFAFLVALQPYLLAVNLQIPPEQRGVVSGDLQFWHEVVSIVVIGFMGAWSDRVGRRIIYIGGFLVMALAYAAYPFADSYAQLLIYRLIFAVAIGMMASMMQVVLADYPIEQDRGKLAGIAVFLNSIGALLAFTLLIRLPSVFHAQGLSEVWSGRATYLTVTGICVFSAVIMFWLRPGRPDQNQPKLPMKTLLAQGMAAGKQPRIALAYAASFMARADLVIVSMFMSLWVQGAALQAGFSAVDAAKKQGMLFGIVQGIALLWAPIFGWLGDRIDRVTLVIVAVVLSIIGYGWFGLVTDPLHSSAFIAAAFLGVGLSSGILATQVLVGQEAPGPIRGSVVGMVVLFGAVGILAISKVGGYAFDHWMPGAPFLIMALANVGLLLFALYVRVARR